MSKIRCLYLLAFFVQLAASFAADLAARAAALEDKFLENRPSLGLAQVYNLMSMEQRVLLAGKLKGMIAPRVPPGIENHPALANLPPHMKEMVKQLSVLANTASPEAVEKVIAAQDLDHLAPIPSPMLAMYHDFVLNGQVGGTTRKALLAADQGGDAWKKELQETSGYIIPDNGPAEVELLAKGDDVPAAEIPQDKLEPALEGAVVVETRIAKFAPHALVNSARLARAMNLLMRPKSAGPVTLKMGGKTIVVDSAEALVQALAADYEIAVFDARMFVNFLDYSIRKLGATLSIRIPTWADTGLKTAAGKPLLVPVCHTEHQMVLYKKGSNKPEALVRWFLAMPDDEAQGTMFRPAIYSRRAWSGWRVVRAYDGPQAATKLVTVAQRVMKAFNYQQAKYQFPGNAYGVLGVCNDTTGLFETAMQGSAERATAWPLVRDPRFDMYLGEALGDAGFATHPAGGLNVLALGCDTRPDLYPGVADPKRMLLRIGANIPMHDLSAMHFRDLGCALEELKRTSPELAAGLSMGPGTQRAD